MEVVAHRVRVEAHPAEVGVHRIRVEALPAEAAVVERRIAVAAEVVPAAAAAEAAAISD